MKTIDILQKLLSKKKFNSEKIQVLIDDNKSIDKEIQKLSNDKDFNYIIKDSLEEEIINNGTRLSLSNYDKYISHPMKINGVVCETDWTPFEFYPDDDKFNIYDIQTKIIDGKTYFRIGVEVEKNRSYIGLDYILDTYWTTWFEKN